MFLDFATPEAEGARDDFMAAGRACGFSEGQIADMLGIGSGQFADQKALRGHLPMWRFKNLPMRVQIEFWKLHGKRLGLTVLEDCDLGEVPQGSKYSVFKKRQAKMALAKLRDEREIA